MYVRSSLFPLLFTFFLEITISELTCPSCLYSTESRHYPVDSSQETLRGFLSKIWILQVQSTPLTRQNSFKQEWSMFASFESVQCQRYVHSSFQMTITFFLSDRLLPSDLTPVAMSITVRRCQLVPRDHCTYLWFIGECTKEPLWSSRLPDGWLFMHTASSFDLPLFTSPTHQLIDIFLLRWPPSFLAHIPLIPA